MVEVGVCPDNMDALRAITARAAVLNGMGDTLGTLEAGKLADMLVVDGKPDQDLSALEKVEMTFIDGKRMHSWDRYYMTAPPPGSSRKTARSAPGCSRSRPAWTT